MPLEGVFLGTWHVLGRELPGVSGVLTFIVRGEAVFIDVQGRLWGTRTGTNYSGPGAVTVNGRRMTLTHLGDIVWPAKERLGFGGSLGDPWSSPGR